MNDISWDFYRTFLAVLQLGSLSAAARQLGLTQPTVGRHIDSLEDAVGYQLFTRSQQGLLPTEPALAMKPYAENFAMTAAAMQRVASGEIGAIKGTVRISASEVIGVEVLPPILACLQDEHPGLELELSLSDSLEDLLKRERISRCAWPLPHRMRLSPAISAGSLSGCLPIAATWIGMGFRKRRKIWRRTG